MTDTKIQKAKKLFFGDVDKTNQGIHTGTGYTDAQFMTAMRGLLGQTEGDATHLYPVWNNTTKVFDMKTLGEYQTLLKVGW